MLLYGSRFGRMTGRVGVCIATSGPRCYQLNTGLATATSEGDPVLAIGGEVPLNERLKKTHQSLDAVTLMKPVTKYSAEVVTVDQLTEIMGNAIHAAESGRSGASFISLPKDIGLAPFVSDVDREWGKVVPQGSGSLVAIDAAAKLINASKTSNGGFGMQASKPDVANSVQNFWLRLRFHIQQLFKAG